MDQHDDHSLKAAHPTVKDRCVAPFDRQDPDQQEVIKIVTGFRQELLGCISLGKDGVLRSLTAHRDVLDAAGLSPRLIKALLDRMPPQFRNGFDEADGTKTPRQQWFNPDKSLLPRPLTDEQKKAGRKVQEDNKMFEENGSNEQGKNGSNEQGENATNKQGVRGCLVHYVRECLFVIYRWIQCQTKSRR